MDGLSLRRAVPDLRLWLRSDVDLNQFRNGGGVVRFLKEKEGAMLHNQRNVLELEFASTASGVGFGSVIKFDPREGIKTGIPYIPQVDQTFPKHFWLGLAMAAAIWALLVLGTAIG